MAARRTPEQHLHYAVADLLRDHAARGVVWFHVYQNSLSVRHGAKMKRLGVRAGVADFVVLLPAPEYGGVNPIIAFLELKSETGKLSDVQKAFRDDVDRIGCFYRTAHTYDDAVKCLSQWGALKRKMKVAA